MLRIVVLVGWPKCRTTLMKGVCWMATQNLPNLTYEIVDGPSWKDLMLGVFDNLRNDRVVKFGLRKNSEADGDSSVRVCLTAVSRKEEPDTFDFEGFVPEQPYRVTGWTRTTGRRTGSLKFLLPVRETERSPARSHGASSDGAAEGD